MAESNGAGCLDVEEDEECDVIFEGSPLHQHLQRMGLAEDAVESRHLSSSALLEKRASNYLTPMQDFNHRGKYRFVGG